MPTIPLRHPSSLPPPPSTTSSSPTPTPTISPPPLTWLSGPWHVTHSTLPMWRKNRNVTITYTPLPTSPPSLDDLVTYQPLSSSKVKSVRGVDKPYSVGSSSDDTGTAKSATDDAAVGGENGEQLASLAYSWRGKGWLAIASSKWEILGWGEEEDGNAYVVTFFAKTVFTPAGVDVYSRKEKLRGETVEGIMEGLRALGGEVERLGGGMFEVGMDGEGEGK